MLPELMNDLLNQKSILYIEDDVVVLTAYRERLRNAGFNVEGTLDGLEAMRILSAREFDLIILDLMLPRFSGGEILQAVRANPRLKNIPVLIFSTNIESAEDPLVALADRALFRGNCSFATMLQTIHELLPDEDHPEMNHDGADTSDTTFLFGQIA